MYASTVSVVCHNYVASLCEIVNSAEEEGGACKGAAGYSGLNLDVLQVMSDIGSVLFSMSFETRIPQVFKFLT